MDSLLESLPFILDHSLRQFPPSDPPIRPSLIIILPQSLTVSSKNYDQPQWLKNTPHPLSFAWASAYLTRPDAHFPKSKKADSPPSKYGKDPFRCQDPGFPSRFNKFHNLKKYEVQRRQVRPNLKVIKVNRQQQKQILSQTPPFLSSSTYLGRRSPTS